ncbi:MAG: tetratricopeptide repeat protein [Acidobacteria bacterium]|nr:tetratricopeptide repeat protein [Acidobacteriota bacterium]
MSDFQSSELTQEGSSESVGSESPAAWQALNTLLESPGRILLLLAGVSILVYLNTLGNGFAYDDVMIVEKNPLLRNIANIPKLFQVGYWDHWVTGSASYRPVLTTTFALNFFITGPSPWGFHLVNILLHTANVWLLFTLLCRYQVSQRLAVMAAILFAIHPVHTEAVANIVGRGEVLAAFGFGLAWLCWQKRETSENPIHRIGFYLCALTSYLAGMLSKEPIIILPVLLFSLDVVRETPELSVRRLLPRLPRLVLPYLGFVVVLGVYFGMRFMAGQVLDQHPAAKIQEMASLTFFGRCATMASMSLEWARLLIIGYPLRPFYDPNHFTVVSHFTLRSWAGLVGVLGLIAIAVKAYRRYPVVTFAIFFWFVTISVVSNILVLIGSIIAERQLYLPSVGVVILIAWAAEQFLFSEKWATARLPVQAIASVTLVMLCVGYVFITSRRNLDWRDSETLFSRFIETDPRSPLGYSVLGNYALERKEYALAGQLFRKSLECTPTAFAGKFGLCRVAVQTGQIEEGKYLARQLVAAQPPNLKPPASDWALVHELYAQLLAKNKEWDAALIEVKKAIELNPKAYDSQVLLANILLETNQNEAALEQLRTLTLRFPEFEQAFNNYGVALARFGKLVEAERQFQRALQLNPKSTEAAHNLEQVRQDMQSSPK